MENAQLIRLFEALAHEQLAVLYSGRFLDEHTAHLITLGEEAVGGADASKALRSRTAFVMVEAYQNVLRHRAQPQPGGVADHSTFMFLHHPPGTGVVTVNAVSPTEVPALQSALHRLHGLGLDELKRLFLRSLQGGERTERGGAGLGLIEMARRTGNALQHTVYPTADSGQRFLLEVRTGSATEGHTLADLRALDELLIDQRCLLVCAGFMGPAVQEVLLRMMGAEGAGGNEAVVRPAMAAMELINAVGTGQGAPLLAWCTSADGEQLRLVLHADEACMARLLAEGEHLQGMEPSAVSRRYRDALLGRLPDGGPELVGLLDLARHAAAPVRLERAMAHGRPVLLLTARI